MHEIRALQFGPFRAERGKHFRRYATKTKRFLSHQQQEVTAMVDAVNQFHVKHAVDKDVDAYMDDFKLERMRYPELEREYAQRAMNLDRLQIEVKAVEFSEITSTSATIHTRQVTQYDDETGTTHIDDAIISYRWIKDANANAWKIAFTERRRLSN